MWADFCFLTEGKGPNASTFLAKIVVGQGGWERVVGHAPL